jgi:outer membrane lipoprotein carrier protein
LLAWPLGASAQSDGSVAGNNLSETDVTDAAKWPAVLEQFLDETESFSGRFEQEIWTDDQQLVERASGTVALLRPNRFRWRYETPYEQVIVADGRSLWMYDVEIDQVTRSNIDDADVASPAMLLGGDGAVRTSFKVLGIDDNEGITWVSLAPIHGSAEFSLVRMGFADASLAALEFVDGLNQTTVIHFFDVQTNTPLARDLFEFKIPRGAHVLGGRG